LAAIDHDPLWTAMQLECFAQEPLSDSEVAPFAERELDRAAVAVDGTVEIPPLTTNLDVGFVDSITDPMRVDSGPLSGRMRVLYPLTLETN
jgi:hypothetical protein